MTVDAHRYSLRQPLRPHRRGGCCVLGVTAAAAAAAPGCEREPPPGALHRQRRRSQQPHGCGASPNRQPIRSPPAPNRCTQLPEGDARAQRLAWQAAVRTSSGAETPRRRSCPARAAVPARMTDQLRAARKWSHLPRSCPRLSACHAVHIAPLRPASDLCAVAVQCTSPGLQIVYKRILDNKCNYSYIVITVSPSQVNKSL
jgi:hypothetical protein